MKKRIGRPPIDATDRSVCVTIRLPSRRYDALARQALQQKQSLPALVRSALDFRTLKSPSR